MTSDFLLVDETGVPRLVQETEHYSDYSGDIVFKSCTLFTGVTLTLGYLYFSSPALRYAKSIQDKDLYFKEGLRMLEEKLLARWEELGLGAKTEDVYMVHL